METQNEIFARLARSAFRARFRLTATDAAFVAERGLPLVMRHARDIVERRLAPARPENDGKQTPYRGHPVFVAQHATATCCRGCLAKIHGIPAGKDLNESEIAHAVAVIERWLEAELVRAPAPPPPPQPKSNARQLDFFE